MVRRVSAVGSSLLILLAYGCSSAHKSTGAGAGSSAGPSGSSTSTATSGTGSSGGTGGTRGTGGATSTTASSGSTSTGGGDAGAASGGPAVDAFMGLNGFIDDPTDKISSVGNIREYHDWATCDGNGAAGYTGYPNNQLQFSLWSGFWDFDAYYLALKTAGVTTVPCIQGGVTYIDNGAMPPVASGADPTAPASYVAHADFMFQYVARYGSVAVDHAKLKLASGQVVASGLGYLSHFENGNEPDANWVHADGSPVFTPQAMAAMSSADYDGHEGKLGSTVGVKNADPTAKMVLAGLAGAGSADWATNVTTYWDGMRAWAAQNRADKAFPADIVNVHFYCFGPDAFGVANPRPGLSPEACGLQATLAKVATYRDTQLPGKEVWLTEFGYDTDPQSRLRAPAIGASSATVVQGQWLVRSYLALMASGIDRAFVFVSREDCTGDATACPGNDVQFATSGVLTQKGQEQPKTAWYYLTTVRTRLGAMRYQGIVDSGNASVSIARFFDGASNQGAYVVWAPTSNATVVDGYALHVASGVTSASLVTLVDGSTTGTEAPLTLTGGSATLQVTETPALVLVNGTP
jgi:hypothetical protein